MYYYLLDVPSIPDWISAIAALAGVVFGGFSLWKLLARDKDKQRQLDTLKVIADAQLKLSEKLDKELIQLVKQTVEFQEQTKAMQDQVTLMNAANQLLLKSHSIEEERIQNERKERIDKIKPRFVFDGIFRQSSGQFGFYVKNTKDYFEANTFSIEIIDVNPSIYINEPVVNKSLDGQRVAISGNVLNSNYRANLSDLTFRIHLVYADIDQNRHFQIVEKKEDNAYSVSEPEPYTSV